MLNIWLLRSGSSSPCIVRSSTNVRTEIEGREVVERQPQAMTAQVSKAFISFFTIVTRS